MIHLGPKRGQNDVLNYLFIQIAVLSADNVYYDRKLWYLGANAGHTAEKILLAPKLAQLGRKRGHDKVFM